MAVINLLSRIIFQSERVASDVNCSVVRMKILNRPINTTQRIKMYALTAVLSFATLFVDSSGLKIQFSMAV